MSSCAQLYSVQIGERNLTPAVRIPFETRVNELGLNVSEAASIAKALGNNNATVNKASKTLDDLWKMISYGPKTGNPVFSDKYADGLVQLAASACPQARTLGVVSIREAMKYPVISGEIVRVKGICK